MELFANPYILPPTQSAGLFAGSGHGIKLDSLNAGYSGQHRATAVHDLERDDAFEDDCDRKVIIRKTEVFVSSSIYKPHA